MDALLLEQHLRSPLGLFHDPMMAQLMQPQSMDAALLEKARQHLQMWGRSPYAEMLLPQMYQRPNINAAMQLGLWQGQWPPQIAAGFLNNQAALQQAAVVAAQQQQQQARSPPPGPGSTPNSQSGSPSPSDTLRSKHFAPRFSPYQIPPSSHTQISPQQPLVTIKPSPSPSRASPEH